ncbi:MAG: Gfo/Idh/MocA family oxidoreductase [Acidimicrobiia bacterium]|nr:Gfo/Idh/MocA family oxidoreductase [Acidimicrobiia bacterium]
MTDKVRLAMVGCGAIASWHLRAIEASVPEIEVTATVDIDPARANALAAETGALAFTDLSAALASDTFDAVDLMLPHHLHEEVATECLNAGMHVLLEKPMAPTPEACARILAVARSSNTVFMVAENAQYWPEINLVADLLAQEAIGEVITARACNFVPPLEEFFGGDDPWRFSQAAAGGGVVMDAGSHWIRPLRMWLGEIIEVVAVVGHPFPGMEPESLCRALCMFDSGVVAVFDSMLAPGPLGPDPLFRVTGTKGELVVDGIGRVKLYDGTEPRGTVVGQGNYLLSYEGELADFASAVLRGTPLAAGPEVAVGELRTALAMYRSHETRRWEPVW